MNEKRFWALMDQLDWAEQGKDDLVKQPVVAALAALPDAEIFAFDEIMSKLLYDIDGQQWYDEAEQLSGDGFLYCRCVALINGKAYYKKVKALKAKLDPELEFEAALYIPAEAWAKKHQKEAEDYPHFTEYSFESFSNVANWPHLQGE